MFPQSVSPQSDPSSGHDEIARRFLKRRHKDLLEGLNLDEIKVQLYSDEVLDTQVQEKLMNPSLGPRNKLEILLHYLTRQGEPGLLALIEGLKKCVEDPTQAKLGLDLELKYQEFLSTNNSDSSRTGSRPSTRNSDVESSDYPPVPPHMVSCSIYIASIAQLYYSY